MTVAKSRDVDANEGAALCAEQQLDAKFLFEVKNGLADRWLRNM